MNSRPIRLSGAIDFPGCASYRSRDFSVIIEPCVFLRTFFSQLDQYFANITLICINVPILANL